MCLPGRCWWWVDTVSLLLLNRCFVFQKQFGLFSVCCWGLVVEGVRNKLESANDYSCDVTFCRNCCDLNKGLHGSPGEFIYSSKNQCEIICHAQLPWEAGGGIKSYITVSCIVTLGRWKICIFLLLLSAFTLTLELPLFPQKCICIDRKRQQTYILKYNFLHFVPLLQMTLPSNSTPTVSFRNYNCCRLPAPGGDLWKLAALPLCKSSANLQSSCGSFFNNFFIFKHTHTLTLTVSFSS